MIKIGNSLHLLFAIVFSLLLVSTSKAQIQVEAELSETNIFTGEQVQLKIIISGTSLNSVDQPSLPEIDQLRWLQGSTSRGSQYSLINGRPSVTYTFGYNFIAQQPGSYTIPAIDVEVNGENYKTEPINFRILDSNARDSDQRSPDIYLRMEPTNESPFVGQQVTADVILYFKSGVEVSSYQASPGWKAEGFWKEELENPQRAQTTSTIINGERYQRAKLLQYALFPTKSGELKLSPFEVSVSLRQRRSANDPFGFGMGQERKNLSTLPVVLNVKSLPDIDEAHFIGAVGDFNFSREISTKSALVGESIEITTIIQGAGNVPLVNKPECDYPESLEKYNPQQNTSISRSNRQISGTKTFTDIVIARNEGNFTIPEMEVAYFDTDANQYRIKTLPALSFEVNRDPDAVVNTQSELRLNVKPVTGLANWRTTTTAPLHQRVSVWILMLFPLLIIGALYAYKVFNEKMNTDVAFSRSQKAKAKVHETLDKATQADDIKSGYHLIEKALVQFITDKLNLPPAGLSSQQIIAEVEKITDEATVVELRRLFSKCESIAYAPNTSQEALEADIEKTKTLIKTIGKYK
ncbi:MAG: BatD family protein [Balneolaceae bacterium]